MKNLIITSAMVFALSACKTTQQYEITWDANSGVHSFTDDHTCIVAPKKILHSERGSSVFAFRAGEIIPYAKFVNGKAEAGVTLYASRTGQGIGNIEMRVDSGQIIKLNPIALHGTSAAFKMPDSPYYDSKAIEGMMKQSQNAIMGMTAKKAGLEGDDGAALVKVWLAGNSVRYRQISAYTESMTGTFDLAGFRSNFIKCSDQSLGADLSKIKKSILQAQPRKGDEQNV